MLTIGSSAFHVEKVTPYVMRMYGLFCRRLELTGCLPCAMAVHGVLAFLCERMGNEEEKQFHLARTCKIGYQEHFLNLLSKCSALMPDDYREQLKTCDPGFAHRVHQMRQDRLECLAQVVNEYGT